MATFQDEFQNVTASIFVGVGISRRFLSFYWPPPHHHQLHGPSFPSFSSLPPLPSFLDSLRSFLSLRPSFGLRCPPHRSIAGVASIPRIPPASRERRCRVTFRFSLVVWRVSAYYFSLPSAAAPNANAKRERNQELERQQQQSTV